MPHQKHSTGFNPFPDLTLRYHSITSRRKVEHQVATLGLDELARDVARLTKGRVAKGPFAGMRLDYEALTIHAAPKFLGTYDQELHHAVEHAIHLNPEIVLNVGCGVGYYAVGFARRLPNASVIVSDSDPKAIKAAQHNAALNDVRVSSVGIINRGQLDRYLTKPGCLIVMDCAGAEFKLLDPVRNPVLWRTHILVEIHPEFGNESVLAEQFANTHNIERIEPADRKRSDIPPQLFPSVDTAAAAVKERTPSKGWLYMTARNDFWR
jgi:Ribosomal protein L11 methyltransferase (PrmA)